MKSFLIVSGKLTYFDTNCTSFLQYAIRDIHILHQARPLAICDILRKQCRFCQDNRDSQQDLLEFQNPLRKYTNSAVRLLRHRICEVRKQLARRLFRASYARISRKCIRCSEQSSQTLEMFIKTREKLDVRVAKVITTRLTAHLNRSHVLKSVLPR